VRNEALFKRARVQMTPRPSGEHRDVITSVGLATQRNRGRELVISITCEITIIIIIIIICFFAVTFWLCLFTFCLFILLTLYLAIELLS
jgi:hypothetical protein